MKLVRAFIVGFLRGTNKTLDRFGFAFTMFTFGLVLFVVAGVVAVVQEWLDCWKENWPR